MPDNNPNTRPMSGHEIQIQELQLAICDIKNEVRNFHDQREERREDLKEIADHLLDLRIRMGRINDDEHKEHHDFIRAYIEEHAERRRARSAIYEKIATGGIWATLLGIASLAWLGIKTKLGA